MVELEGRVKRARVYAAIDVARLTLGALQDLGLPTSDRDKMLAKDMITTAAFTGQHHFTGEGHRLEDGDKDVCLQALFLAREAGAARGSGQESQKALPGRQSWVRTPQEDCLREWPAH